MALLETHLYTRAPKRLRHPDQTREINRFPFRHDIHMPQIPSLQDSLRIPQPRHLPRAFPKITFPAMMSGPGMQSRRDHE